MGRHSLRREKFVKGGLCTMARVSLFLRLFPLMTMLNLVKLVEVLLTTASSSNF